MTAGRSRGRLSSATKAQLVVQALRPGAHVATLAQRHGVTFGPAAMTVKPQARAQSTISQMRAGWSP